MHRHHHQRAGLSRVAPGHDRRAVRLGQLAVGDEREHRVVARAVDEHEVQPGAGAHQHPPARQRQLGGIVPQAIVVAGHHREPPAERREAGQEPLELVDATAIGHIAGDDHVIDVGGHQRGHQLGAAAFEPTRQAEVQIGQVGEHAGSRHREPR